MQTKEKPTSEVRRRESIILSSVLFNQEVREFAIHNEIDDRLLETGGLKKILSTFNAYASVGREPTEHLIIERISPDDEKIRENMKNKFAELKEKYPPQDLETTKVHIKMLKERQLLNKYESMLDEALKKIKERKVVPLSDEFQEVKLYLEKMMYDLQDEKIDDESKSMDLIEGFYYTIQKMREAKQKDGKSERVTSGYGAIDKVLAGGFTKGTFALIAGRPGMGKTVVMLNLALEAARHGAKVLFLSIEMNLIQCFQRILSKMACISGKLMQQPKEMEDNHWRQLEKAGKEIVDMYEDRFWIEEVTNLTVPQFERRVQQYKKKHDIDLVFVDYAQIMLTKDGNEPEKQEDFGQISGALRRASKSQNVAVVVGSQLNRKVEERTDKRPIMADIRNSGAFEQDAAQIIGLYRDEQYNKEDSEKKGILELIFLKNRFGEAGVSIDLACNLDLQSINELDSAA